MVTEAASGSPKLESAGLATFNSGGPSSVGSIGSLGSGFLITAVGGVNCVIVNRGALPLVAGNRRTIAATASATRFVVPGRQLGDIGRDIEAGHINCRLVLGFNLLAEEIPAKRNHQKRHNTSVHANAVACVQLQFSSFDQMSFTLIGLLVTRNGGSFVGKKSSLTRSLKLPKFPPQSTSRRLLTTLFGAAGADTKNFRLSASPRTERRSA